jgi:hypothetical protein
MPVQGNFKGQEPFLRDGSERVEDEWQGCRLPALLDRRERHWTGLGWTPVEQLAEQAIAAAVGKGIRIKEAEPDLGSIVAVIFEAIAHQDGGR